LVSNQNIKSVETRKREETWGTSRVTS